jgi:hypothetical protein
MSSQNKTSNTIEEYNDNDNNSKGEENILNKYRSYLNGTEYKDLPNQLNPLLSEQFCVCSESEDVWWRENVTQHHYIDYWKYLEPSRFKNVYYVTNPLCKISHVNEKIFLEIHDEITKCEEPTTWLKARFCLKNVNGIIIKHGIQEVWYNIPKLKHVGYHTVEREGKKIRYKLLKSQQMYRYNYSENIKDGMQLRISINYENNDVICTDINEWMNGKIIRSQSWYPSGKQQNYKYSFINNINGEENSIFKEWKETGELLSLTQLCKEFVRNVRWNESGQLICNVITKKT